MRARFAVPFLMLVLHLVVFGAASAYWATLILPDRAAIAERSEAGGRALAVAAHQAGDPERVVFTGRGRLGSRARVWLRKLGNRFRSTPA